MSTICYSCKKEIGFFKARGTTKDIIRGGYNPPEGMSDNDRLCQTCLYKIKGMQAKGKPLNEHVNMPIQIILCLIFPIFAFWRINRVIRFLKYYFIIVAITITITIAPLLIDKNSETAMILFGGGLLFLYLGMWVIPLYWVITWSNEHNKNSI